MKLIAGAILVHAGATLFGFFGRSPDGPILGALLGVPGLALMAVGLFREERSRE